MKPITRLFSLVGAIAVLSLTAIACSSAPPPEPAPAIDEAALRSAVQEAVRDAVPAAPAQQPQLTANQIQELVETAISSAIPEGASAAEIRSMVEDAVEAASQPGVTRDEVADLVSQAVSEASSGAQQLTAEEVRDIVSAAIADLPTPAPAMAPVGEPVKIGTLLAFTGDLSAFGPPMRNGADLAVDLLNDAGGVLGRPVRAVHKDSGTSPQVATDSARALVTTENINAIVGPLASGITQAVANSVTVPNEVVLITPSGTSPAITLMEDNDFVFRTTVSDAAQGVILARLARELEYDSAAAMYVNNAYGDGLANVFKTNFESAGGTVTALVPQESGQPSYQSELGNATEGSPEVLVAIGYPESAGVYLREAIEGSFIDTFMFVDGTKNQEMFDTLGVESFEGFYGTAPGTPESDASMTFRQLYEDRYFNLPTNPFIGETFDAFVVIALAIEKAGSTEGPAIRNALRDVANAPGEKVGPGDLARALELIRNGQDIDYEGVAGSQNFDQNGDVLNTIEIWKIENGVITSTGRFETP